MTSKKYFFIKLAVTIIIASITALAISTEKYLIPIPIVIIGALVLFYLKKSVKEVLEDERDYDLAGKSARYSLIIFASLAVVSTFILLSLRQYNPYFDAVATTLSYSVCFILIVHSITFKYLSIKDGDKKRKVLFSILFAALAFLLLVSGLRLFSGEDDWICEKGEWIKHGQPDFPAPDVKCE